MNKKQVKREYKKLWQNCWKAAHSVTKAEIAYMEAIKACNEAYDDMMDAETEATMALDAYVENWENADRMALENILWSANKSAETKAVVAKEAWDKAWQKRKDSEFKVKSYYQNINMYILFWDKYAKKLGHPGAGKKLYNSFFATF